MAGLLKSQTCSARASHVAPKTFASAHNLTPMRFRRPQAKHVLQQFGAAAGRERSQAVKSAAVEEQQSASAEVAPEQTQEVAPAEVQLTAEDCSLLDLDENQEHVLKWLLTKTDEEQDADLDEAMDFDEFGDEEYSELREEVDAMYDQFDYDFKVGDKVMGTVIELDDEGAYIEIGAKAAGFCPLTECSFAKLKTPLEVLRVGMRREFMVVEDENDEGEVVLSLAAMEANIFWQRIRQLQEEDVTVYVTVDSATKGGLLVTYGPSYEGFVPVSQFGPSITPESMEDLIGVTLPVKFLEVDEELERLVFSNKRASSNTEVQGFKVGDVVQGVVQSVKPYGAFVDLGGVTGLLHVSQISHERVQSVEKILSEGDKLKVMILSQDRDRGRVTLSTKKLEPTPGDMLRDPQMVFDKAEEMAATFRERVAAAELAARAEDSRPDDPFYEYNAAPYPQ